MAMKTSLHLLLKLFVLSWYFKCSYGQLVGGGGMTTYGGGGRRHGGYARVSEPGKGFFIAGSTIRGVNGVYKRVHELPTHIHELHGFQLVYHNGITGWYIALVDAPSPEKGYGAYGGSVNEWVILDEEGKDRFGHVGNTIIPGSGDRWGHLDSRYGGAMEPEEVIVGPDGEIETKVWSTDQISEWHATRRDQLPWQLIMIGGEENLKNLQNMANYRNHRAKQAEEQQNIQMIADTRGGPSSSSQFPPSNFASQPDIISKALTGSIETIQAINKAGEVFNNLVNTGGNAAEWNEAAELFSQAAEMCRSLLQRWSNNLNTRWTTALVELHVGICLRLARKPNEASIQLRKVLELFPRYTAALHELALCQLDGYNYDGALAQFELISNLDKKFPMLKRWLLITVAHTRRAADSPQTPKQQSSDKATREEGDDNGTADAALKLANDPNHYAVLGLALDFTADELKRAYRSASLRFHPDKKGGSPDAFARVALAHQVLGDPEQREEFDSGMRIPASYANADDIKRGLGPYLVDEVEENYFPETFPYWPFGDPFEDKPDLKLRRKKLAEKAAEEAAEQWYRDHPRVDLSEIPML